MSGSGFPSLSEYHARQRAVAAEGEAARASASARDVRGALRDVEKRLRRVLEKLDEGDASEARAGIEAALEKLGRIGV